MPTPAKPLESIAKNMTKAEREARAAAEAGIMPDRGRSAELTPPALMSGNAAAKRYWKGVLKRMAEFVILDDLDSDALGVYCVMMARYEQLCKAQREATKSIEPGEDAAEALSQLDALNSKLQSLERNILQYADKLGLTPSGRVRLAQRRAAVMAASVDPDGDLFGD